MHAGLHRTAPGVTEQLVDCSGGDVKDEETGFARKADALARVMGREVRMLSLTRQADPAPGPQAIAPPHMFWLHL